MLPSPRSLPLLALLALASAATLAPHDAHAQDEGAADRQVTLYLKDGTQVSGELLARTDTAYILRGPNGEALEIPNEDVARALLPQDEVQDDGRDDRPLAIPPDAAAPPPAQPAQPRPPAQPATNTLPPPAPAPPDEEVVPSRVFSFGGNFGVSAWGHLVPPGPYDRVTFEDQILGDALAPYDVGIPGGYPNPGLKALSFDVATFEFRYFLDETDSIDIQLDILDLIIVPFTDTPRPYGFGLYGFGHLRFPQSVTFEWAVAGGGGVRVEGQPRNYTSLGFYEAGRAGMDFTTRDQSLEVGLYLRGELGQLIGWGPSLFLFDITASLGLEVTVMWNKTRP